MRRAANPHGSGHAPELGARTVERGQTRGHRDASLLPRGDAHGGGHGGGRGQRLRHVGAVEVRSGGGCGYGGGLGTVRTVEERRR